MAPQVTLRATEGSVAMLKLSKTLVPDRDHDRGHSTQDGIKLRNSTTRTQQRREIQLQKDRSECNERAAIELQKIVRDGGAGPAQ